MKHLLDQLSIEDLQKHPIWLVENGRIKGPSEKKTFSRDETSPNLVYPEIVFSTFHLADKTQLYGYCSPWDISGFDYMQPVIIYRGIHVKLYNERLGAIDHQEVAMQVGKRDTDIFPMRLETLVGGPFGKFQITIE